jgi:hypothetical protein
MQTSTREGIRRGRPGKQYGIHPIKAESMVAELDGVGYGLCVIQGTDEDQAVLPSGDFNVANVRGMVMQAHELEMDYPTTGKYEGETYSEGELMSIAREGEFYVKAIGTEITRTDAVYVQHTENGDAKVGMFRNNVDGSNAKDVSSKFSWFRKADADGIAVLTIKAG